MQKSNLSVLFDIQKLLQELKYPDYKRVSLEVLEYVNNTGTTVEEIFSRLKANEPWEYIRGYAEFMNFNFIVSKDTLIPRIETEKIVYTVLDILQKEDIKNIVDVGTGTGCIPISIAKLTTLPYSIHATDISDKALNIAKRNEQNILKINRINWIKTDLIKDLNNIKGATLFTANLPYIPTKQYRNLDRSVSEYEPRLALDGGETGLEVYERFFKQLSEKNFNTKYIILETETSIFKNTIQLAEEYFRNTEITPLKDVFDRDRFLLIRFF